MKKFLLTILAFTIVFFIVEKSLVLLRNAAPSKEVDKRLEMILTGKINADVLIFGSSRGARDIIASQLGDSLKVSAYNLSYPGSGISFQEFLLKETLKNNNKKPALVILTVDDPSELLENTNLNFRLDRLYPLVKYPEVRNVLVEQGHKNKYLSELFIVHQLNISNFDLRQKKFKPIDTLLSDGSMPISFTDHRFNKRYITDTTYYIKENELEQQRASFLNFINICSENNIKMVVVSPPNFYKPTVGFFERMATLTANKATLMIYDTTDLSYKTDANLFSDDVHLKTNGAIKFTNELYHFITNKQLLKN